jgi:hypothetical protein
MATSVSVLLDEVVAAPPPKARLGLDSTNSFAIRVMVSVGTSVIKETTSGL